MSQRIPLLLQSSQSVVKPYQLMQDDVLVHGRKRRRGRKSRRK